MVSLTIVAAWDCLPLALAREGGGERGGGRRDAADGEGDEEAPAGARPAARRGLPSSRRRPPPLPRLDAASPIEAIPPPEPGGLLVEAGQGLVPTREDL